jgi:hypothetical protein
MAYRAMFNAKQREDLWLRCRTTAYLDGRGDGTICICNLCDLPVYPTDAWDESHDPAKPKSFGGKAVGVAHRRCNRDHGAQVVTPAKAKSDRVRRRALGITRPGMGRHAMPAGRRSNEKRKIGGGVEPRLTMAQKEARFQAKRGILHRPEA